MIKEDAKWVFGSLWHLCLGHPPFSLEVKVIHRDILKVCG